MKYFLSLICVLLVSALCIILMGMGTPCVLYAGTEGDTLDLPIVMYHSVLKSRQSKYVIHPDDLERDIVAFLGMGYTPVTLREVVAWVDGVGTLPEKPMIITFDDGHHNNLHYALPILQKHNCKAVINVVTSFSKFSTETPGESNNPSYSYLSWDNITELHNSGLIEIGNHTHALHKFKPRYGIATVSGETSEEYKTVIRNDLTRANEHIMACGAPQPVTFAYPFGKYTREGKEVLAELGFRAILTCNEGISKITRGNPATLMELKRYNRSGNTSTESFIKKVFE